jgi:hypothetical protein
VLRNTGDYKIRKISMKTKLVLKYRRDDKSYLCYDIVVIVMGDGRWEMGDGRWEMGEK